MEPVIILMHLQVAVRLIVRNFTALVVENCLLDPLSDIFSPETVMGFDDNLTRQIAAESEDSQIERARIIEKIKILQDGLQSLGRLGRVNTLTGW